MFSELPQSPEELLSKGGLNAWQHKYAESKNWIKIPLLNYTPLHLLRDRTLVRFRGMVQDMLDPEMYLERYEVKMENGQTRLQEGKFLDCLKLSPGEEVLHNSESNVFGERRTLFVVSNPGLNDWAKTIEQNCNQNCMEANNLYKTAKDSFNGQEIEGGKKRSAPIDDEEMAPIYDIEQNVRPKSPESQKRQRIKETSQTQNNSLMIGTDYLLNSPIPERPSFACMIKLYEHFDTCKLNTLVDVIGFLSVDPSLDASLINEEMCENVDIQELQAQNPPPSLIPRLHAICVKQMPHANPLLDVTLWKISPELEIPNMYSISKELKLMLSLCLFNDNLAAEYLLSHLISTVYGRSELESIGQFALNICNLPKACLPKYTQNLYKIIELLTPSSHYLPMTLDGMNNLAFVPKKDYTTNKLVSGVLQLGPHTHLVLDETCLQAGKLEANGVHGVQHLANLINNQQLKCDFQFYNIDYDVNVPVMVLSEGRSMLPSDFILPLQHEKDDIQLIDESFKAAQHYLQAPMRLEQFRRYLTLARIGTFNVNDAQTEVIQEDFVQMRRENAKSNAQDLHALLILSRLLAIARGKNELDKECWELAKEFENKRRQRVNELPNSTSFVRH